MDNRVELQGRREPGPGWGTDAPRNQTQDFCLFGPLPFPKHPENHNKMTDRRLRNSVFTTLAGLLGFLLSRLMKVTLDSSGKSKIKIKALAQNDILIVRMKSHEGPESSQ